LIHYERYQGTRLTEKGQALALSIIRKHRLWEVFLVDKLNFNWDEVHDIAEELEHIHSDELINRLEAFLDHPKFDPHGDPIPTREGEINRRNQLPLTELSIGETGMVTGVRDSSKSFLQYLDQLNIELGHRIQVQDIVEFDQSRVVRTEGKAHSMSQQVCKNLFVIKQ
jgi:DtxR family Mn-dependent transcriptional regulator